MPREIFDPSPEESRVVLIDDAVIRRAEAVIVGCQSCSADEAEIPFDWILDELTVGAFDWMIDKETARPRRAFASMDHVIERAGRCPNCGAAILEKTPVKVRDDGAGDDSILHQHPQHSKQTE